MMDSLVVPAQLFGSLYPSSSPYIPCCPSTDATAAAFYAARPRALRLLRQLAQASKAAARQLQEEGLVRFALDQLLRPAGMAVEASPAGSSGGSGISGSLKQRGQLTEALRLWRSFAQHGFYLLLLDDAYPSLCTSFTPPPLPAAVGNAAHEQLQQWAVAREAYSAAAQLCWHAARCDDWESGIDSQQGWLLFHWEQDLAVQ